MYYIGYASLTHPMVDLNIIFNLSNLLIMAESFRTTKILNFERDLGVKSFY